MREILFRGKSRNNGKWYQGDLVTVAHKRFIDDDIVKERVIPETVGQYAGLNDNNGKKIFEGDICRFYDDEEYSDYEVFFTTEASNSQAVGFYIRQLDTGAIDSFDNFFAVNCEVIGNIHDNSELLKESEDKQPTADVVEVVRCKECKYLLKDNLLKDKMICTHKDNRVFGTAKTTFANAFCSYGERKEQP